MVFMEQHRVGLYLIMAFMCFYLWSCNGVNEEYLFCSMDVDLSKELMQPSKATLERQVAAARRAASSEQV